MAHLHANAAKKRRVDPTRTLMLRRRYELAIVSRIKKLKPLIYEACKKLGLGDGIVGNDFSNIPNFDFPTSAQKVDGFMSWLYDQIDGEILEVHARAGMRITGRSDWQNLYVRSAYQKGLNDAYPRLEAAGYTGSVELGRSVASTAFNQPIHADALGLLYTRNFEELKGITGAMGHGIARSLAQGLAEGRGAADMARKLNKAVDDIGIVRSRMLARTEVIRAYAESSLNAFETAGVKGVALEAEVLTADDDKVCEECADASAQGPMSLDDARGLIPFHPNCRCAWRPIVEKQKEEAA